MHRTENFLPIDGPILTVSTPFLVGKWLVFPDRNEILYEEYKVHLEPLTMRLLCLLVNHSGKTVTRDQIVDHLWNGRLVTDDAIARQIKKLRDALGDDPKHPEIIQTIPKIGIRLIPFPEPAANAVNTRLRRFRSLRERLRLALRAFRG